MNRLHTRTLSRFRSLCSTRTPRLAVALVIGLVVTAPIALFAKQTDTVDYVGMNFSPTATANGNSGNWTITEDVSAGTNIIFQLKYQIITEGRTASYPRDVTFRVSTELKPTGASDAIVTGVVPHTFVSAASNFTDTITITAPTAPGAYQVKIQALDTDTGTNGTNGLLKGNGIVISFTVAESTVQCALAVATLAVQDQCGVLLHQPSRVSLYATLADGATLLSDRVVRFVLDGAEVGQAITDSNGLATLTGVNVSTLRVGDHTVQAYYDGDGCAYAPTSGSGNLGVEYLFNGFQQPINADGTSVFSGRNIPVKIKISDYYGTPVPDAEAHVFYAFGTPAVIGTDAEPLSSSSGDAGNLMRYDATSGQYIFNWDISSLVNGTYSLRVGLGEGICGEPHVVQLSVKKKK
jgi:hypothetical protein